MVGRAGILKALYLLEEHSDRFILILTLDECNQMRLSKILTLGDRLYTVVDILLGVSRNYYY